MRHPDDAYSGPGNAMPPWEMRWHERVASMLAEREKVNAHLRSIAEQNPNWIAAGRPMLTESDRRTYRPAPQEVAGSTAGGERGRGAAVKHSRDAEENTFNIDQAVRAARPSLVDTGAERSHALLHLPATRHVSESEDVDVSAVNGRQPQEWEEGLIRSARERERAQEWRP